jgi:hypothetical protein
MVPLNMVFVGVLYPGYHRSPVMAQISRDDRFLPAASSWGTTHPVLDMAPPLQAEEDGPPTSKELIPEQFASSLHHATLNIGGHDFTTCLLIPSPTLTQEGPRHPVAPPGSSHYRISTANIRASGGDNTYCLMR